MKEACGVFGVHAPGAPVARLVFDGLLALQHRGQESAGIAVSDGETITVLKDMGLVASVFDERSLSSLEGDLALGHVRYSTTGPSTWHNAQPVFRSVGRAGFALAHNGNLTNTAELADEAGMLPGVVTSDSDLVSELIARSFPPEPEPGDELASGGDSPLAGVLGEVVGRLRGAFALGVMDRACLMAVRDPHGFRPLCLGRFDYEVAGEAARGWAIASESAALDVIGAELVRSVEEGELVVIDGAGPRSIRLVPKGSVEPRLCIFELVYFARPDSILAGREVYSARRRMGELLATEAPVEADLVIGVPDSGVTAAEGYALASGTTYGQALVKNRYIGRTFIAPTPAARSLGVRRKLNPLKESIAGKRLVVVDDSIVRGTTTRQIVRTLKEAGASEVHLRISSPPFRWPCYYGIDTPARDELVAARCSVEDVRDHVGASSLAYLSLEHLMEAVRAPGQPPDACDPGAGGDPGADGDPGAAGFCRACLTGAYPTAVPLKGAGRVLA